MDQILKEIQKFTSPTKNTPFVSGKISDQNGIPIQGVLVIAYDLDMRTHEELGQQITHKDGRYKIFYNHIETPNEVEENINLKIRVYTLDKSTLLYDCPISEVRFDAKDEENFDIVIDRKLVEKESLFAIVDRAVKENIQRIDIDKMKEDDEHQDITYVSKECNIEKDKVLTYVISNKLSKYLESEKLELSLEVIFGMLVMGTVSKYQDSNAFFESFMSIDLNIDAKLYFEGVSKVELKNIEKDLRSAQKSNKISNYLKDLDNIKKIQTRFSSTNSDQNHNRLNKLFNLISDNLVSDSGLDTKIFFESSKNPSEIFDSLRTGNLFKSGNDEESVKIKLALSEVFGNNQMIINSFVTKLDIKNPDDISEIARFNKSELVDKLEKITKPLEKKGLKVNKSILSKHASYTVRELEKKYPNIAYNAQVNRNNAKDFKNHKEIDEIFSANDKLDLRSIKIEDIVKIKDKSIKNAVIDELKTHQRVYKLIPHYSKSNELIKLGYNSAHDIVNSGKSTFINKIQSNSSISKKDAEEIFKKSEKITASATLIAGEVRNLSDSNEPAYELMEMSGASEKIKKDFPNLKTLFKGIDSFDCNHCRSVYSPSAYFVELLEFLDKRQVSDITFSPPIITNTAKATLFERRPDLGEIDLSCENSNTPIPYIDLVCEVLEDQIAPQIGIQYSGNLAKGSTGLTGIIHPDLADLLNSKGFTVQKDATVYHTESTINVDTLPHYIRDKKYVFKADNIGVKKYKLYLLKQTLEDEKSLAAYPEYINDAAYTKLANAKFAFKLPFNLWHLESLNYFSRFDFARDDFIIKFSKTIPTDELLASSYLKLSTEDKNIIFVADPTNQQKYWNTTAVNASTELKIVDTALDKFQISYVELDQLLSLKSIDRNNDLFIKHLDLTPDTTQKIIENLDDKILDLIHRFLRFHNLTKLSYSIIDTLITEKKLGDNKLDIDLLVKYYKLRKIEDLTGIKLTELLCSFGEIPYANNPKIDEGSLYNNIFQNKQKVGELNNLLVADTLDSSKDLIDVLDYLALCYQIKSSEVEILFILLPDTKLTISNLSKLYFFSRLIRKLKLKSTEIVQLQKMLGINPTDDVDDAFEFINQYLKIKSSPLKIIDLDYYLNHQGTLLSNELKESVIHTILSDIQIGYQNAFIADKSQFDQLLSYEDNKNNLKISLERINGMDVEEINNVLDIIDKKYTNVTDATNYLNNLLDDYFDTTDIINKLNDLDTASVTNFPKAQNNLCKSLMDSISVVLYNDDKYAILTETLTSNFKIEEEKMFDILSLCEIGNMANTRLSDVLLSDDLIDKINENPILPVIDPSVQIDQFSALKFLHKFVSLINSLKLSKEKLKLILNYSSTLGWINIMNIPFDPLHPHLDLNDFLNLCKLINLSTEWTPVANPNDSSTLISFESVINQIIIGDSRSEIIPNLSALLNYEESDVDELDNYFNNPFNIDFYIDVNNWLKLVDALEIKRILNMKVTNIPNLMQETLDKTSATNLKIALKDKYDENTWNDTLKSLTDNIRPLKRDALVTYLLNTRPEFKDTNDLYDFYLIDTQMESLVMSSRIVIAHNVCQLFTQRCLMGLEPKSCALVNVDSGWEQWVWMKNYRVWEANRKVFLYPENWIEPELRDDKSYLFKELEDELNQNELNDYNLENTFSRYMEKLDEISLLEIVASWYDENDYTMHVFGRTKGGDPKKYFYRRLDKERLWSAWVRVDLEIPSKQVLAFKRNNRLSLAWPVFSYEPAPELESKVPSSTPGTIVTNDKPKKKLKIQIAVSELANGVWQAKKVSEDAIKTPSTYITDEISTNEYNFMYLEATSQILVFRTQYYGGSENQLISGIFNVTGCKGYPELAYEGNSYFPDFYPDFKDANLTTQRYFELGYDTSDSLSVRNAVSMFAFYDILMKTPGTFRITYPLQFTQIDLVALMFEYMITSSVTSSSRVENRRLKLPLGTLLPYFDEDSERAYVIIPGFYSREGRINRKDNESESVELVEIEKTASDVLKLIKAITNLINKYKKKFAEDPSYNATKMIAELVVDDDFLDIVAEIKIYLKLRYGEKFKNLYHPLVCSLRKTLYKEGINKLMTREVQMQVTGFNFDNTYSPTSIVPLKHPIEDIDFTVDGSYSIYNWELFYHIPSLIASKLTTDQKFEVAMKWYHYIFNPTGALAGTVPQKYWVTKPFFQTLDKDYIKNRIENIMYNLADKTSAERAELEIAVEEWRENPFKPHVVAKMRPVAYQKATVMKYIQNLIDWGDYLFRQDTMESIVQATQMYILADKILGKKPRTIPNPIEMPVETYNQIERSLDSFSNALIELENILPDLSILPEGGKELPPTPLTLGSLYFCIPKNDKVLELWDVIDDRLFKIRNSENIDGEFRSLALFAPPIDPAMLVRAAASGLDIGTVLASFSAPTPFYRFTTMIALATDFTNEVRYLGNELLSVLEKKDAESMSQLRSNLEKKILDLQTITKKMQIDEAKNQIEVLKANKRVVEERIAYYGSLEMISDKEQLNMDKLDAAVVWQTLSTGTYALGAALALIPDMQLGASGFGGSPHGSAKFGGSLLAHSTDAIGKGLSIGSTIASFEATRAATLGQYSRRFKEWQFQMRVAMFEKKSVEKQIAIAEFKVKILESDFNTQLQNLDNWKKSDEFLRTKFTNKDLYTWLSSETMKIYFKSYKLAYDMALKAEKTYQFELGNNDTFIQFGYWDSAKKGLTSADKLLGDIKRMQANYINKNKRYYEISKSISLAKLDPLALQRLKLTGVCDFELPEALFDMDHAGQYFRRIKAVSLSIPCVTGPYTSVSAKLSQISNKYRKNSSKAAGATTTKEEYEEVAGNDERFVYNVGAIQSIATSHSQTDAGVFELNFNDERYLPFEGTGAISSWRLTLPKLKQFDYESISDLVIHVSYTSREGGSVLKSITEECLIEKLAEIKQDLNQTGTHHSFSLRTSMPKEWNLLKKNGTVDIKIDKGRLPYFVQPLAVEIQNTVLLAEVDGNPTSFVVAINGANSNMSRIDELKICKSEVSGLELDTVITLSLTNTNLQKLKDLEIIVKYGV